MVSAAALQGGCHCGQVRYEAGGTPYHLTLCHCTDCRRTTGAPAVAWFSVPASRFRLVQGSPTQYRSSASAWRTFCGACGTPLTYQRDGSDEIDITTCSLDDPEALPPEDQTFARSRLRWMHELDTLPAHATLRPE
jgi:hypothetical protein